MFAFGCLQKSIPLARFQLYQILIINLQKVKTALDTHSLTKERGFKLHPRIHPNKVRIGMHLAHNRLNITKLTFTLLKESGINSVAGRKTQEVLPKSMTDGFQICDIWVIHTVIKELPCHIS